MGSVGPKIPSVGLPSAADICIGPESLAITKLHILIRAAICLISVSGASFALSPIFLIIYSASFLSSGPQIIKNLELYLPLNPLQISTHFVPSHRLLSQPPAGIIPVTKSFSLKNFGQQSVQNLYQSLKDNIESFWI